MRFWAPSTCASCKSQGSIHWDTIGGPELQLGHLTPANLMKSNLRLITKNPRITRVEPHPTYDSNYMNGRVINKDIIAWGNLGNSKNRSEEQIIEANKLTTDFLTSLDRNKIVAFTDGSALGKPGPCGAGAVVYRYGLDSEPSLLHKAISSRSTSYHGELAAIKLALDHRRIWT